MHMYGLIIYIFIKHTLLTFPSLLIHGVLNTYNKYTVTFPKPRELHNKNVIACVYGRNGNPANFKPTIDNLKSLSEEISEEELIENGFTISDDVIKIDGKLWIIAIPDLGQTGYTTIDTDSGELKKGLSIYHNCNIILVCLSKGGLTGMRYSSKYNDARIKAVITLSSPLLGTGVVIVFPETSNVYTSLSWNNTVIQEINKDRKTMNAEVFHIAPSYDNLIIPVSSSYYPDTPKSHIYFYEGIWYSHLGIPHNPEVAKHIIKWVSNLIF